MAKRERQVKRPYVSAVRSQRAKRTRLSIAAAAGRLFANHGYVATSIDDVAAAAGVGRATVFTSIGGKPELLKEAYRLAVRGEEDAATPLGQQARSREIMGRSDPGALLAGYAGVLVGIGRRLGPLYEAVRAAAHADPEARQLWDQLTGERRIGAGRVIAALVERDALPAGLDPDSATDILWVLNDPALFHLLVRSRRWSEARFQAWLTLTMQQQFLKAPGAA